MRFHLKAALSSLLLLFAGSAVADDTPLLGLWRLAGDAKDSSGKGNHGRMIGVDPNAPGPDGQASGAARFDGKNAWIEIPSSPSLQLGKADFSLAAWVHTEKNLDAAVGDLAAKFDPVARRGFNWTVKSGAGAVNSQANDRNVQFGVDSGTKPVWSDVGRPGNAVYVMAMAVHDGRLYVGTCEAGPNDAGHVYRYDGESRWADLGSPDRCNAVTSLASFDGRLYAGTGKYRLAGSSLEESKNPNPGGKIARLDPDGSWADVGRLANVEAVGGLVVFRGELYASSLYRPAGFHRYKGGREWEAAPLPKDGRRVVALGVFDGYLYAGSYDACAVYRFDGKAWEALGELEKSGQTYSFETYAGNLYVGTWPLGRVFRLDEGKGWTSVGRLGEELEVMGMAVHNGKLYGGTLPLAEVRRYDGEGNWTDTGRVDLTPNVRYRRAWSMALHQGRLFCGTLPSGRVHALKAGQAVSHDFALKPGWRHLAAVRRGGGLSLFVDGVRVSSTIDPAGALDVSNDEPLRLGFGATDHFRGSMSDVRLYGKALSDSEVAELARRK